MNKSLFTAAWLLAAAPLMLSSCSKSPLDEEISLLDKVASILENTTVENADSMLGKLSDLEKKADEIAVALKAVDKNKLSTEERVQLLKALERFSSAGDKLSRASNSEKISQALRKAGVIFTKVVTEK